MYILMTVEYFSSAYCESDPIWWSNDSRYIYFHLFHCVEPGIVSVHFYEIDQVPDNLFRMDIETGAWEEIAPRANVFSFSPTGRRLIYLLTHTSYGDSRTVDVSVLDLKTGDSVLYTLNDYLTAGYVLWSEDGTKAYFSAERGVVLYLSEDPHTYTIYMIDMGTQKITRIYTFERSEKIIFPTGTPGTK